MRKVNSLPTLMLCASLLPGCTAQPAANPVAPNNHETAVATPHAAQDRAPEATGAAGKAEGETTPDALVADLYQQSKRKSPFFQTDDRALVDRYFAKSTADLIWKDAVQSKGEIGALEADPLYDAQDTEIKNFSVGSPEVRDGKAEVVVSFQNFGKREKLIYTLSNEGGGWKIADIKYQDGRTLVRMLKGS